MKLGEKILFAVAAVLTVAAVAQVLGRSSHGGKPPQPRDYTQWSEGALKGYALYKHQGCNSCHRVLRMGEIGVAPVLDGEGTRRSKQWLRSYFENPRGLVPGSAHDGSLGPDFRDLEVQQRQVLVDFMASLKANPGSSNYPLPPSAIRQPQ